MQSVGCTAYISHNALQTSSEILSTEVKATVTKIFLYLHIHTSQVEELKEFCDFVDEGYKQIIESVKTRRFSLQPAVTKVISMFPALKSYFLTREKCSTMLRKLFNDPIPLRITGLLDFWKKSKNPVALSIIRRPQNPLESTNIPCLHLFLGKCDGNLPSFAKKYTEIDRELFCETK